MKMKVLRLKTRSIGMIIAFAALFCSCSQKTLSPVSNDEPRMEVDYEYRILDLSRKDNINDISFPEVMPTFKAKSASEFSRWVHSNIGYPVDARNSGIYGRVQFSFVIDTDGSIKDIRIESSPHQILSKEVIRLVSSSGPWTPGEDRGEKVKVRFSMFVNFLAIKFIPSN